MYDRKGCVRRDVEMARKSRLEFAGAIYHVISRGNYCKALLEGDAAGEAKRRLSGLAANLSMGHPTRVCNLIRDMSIIDPNPFPPLDKMRYLFAYLFFIACAGTSFAQSIVPTGKVFSSPDGSKSVELADFEGEYRYRITDEQTGTTSVLNDEYNPVFAIVWSRDSKSIFIAAHVARGVLVQILHLNNNQWDKFTIDVPEKQSHESTVLDWNIKAGMLTLVCKVTLQEENGKPYECYEGTFNVDPATGETSDLRKRVLTTEECCELKSKFVPY